MRQEHLTSDFVKQALAMGLTAEDIMAGEDEENGKKLADQFLKLQTETIVQDAAKKQAASQIQKNREDSAAMREKTLPHVPENILARQAEGVVLGLGGKIMTAVVRPFDSEQADEYVRHRQNYAEAIRAKDIEQIGAKGARALGWARGAADSIGTAMGLSVAGPYGIIAGFGMLEGNDALTAATDAGLTGADRYAYAGRAAVIEAAIAASFQKVGWGGFESMFSGNRVVRSGFKGIIKEIGKSLGQEIPEELITESLHNANRALSDVDPNALSKENMWQTVIDTVMQTILSVGFQGGVQGYKSQAPLKEQESIAQALSAQHGIEADSALAAIQRASRSKEDSNTALGREIEKERLKTPAGIATWVAANPDKAKELTQDNAYSRKSFSRLGLPEMSKGDRANFVDNARGLVSEALAEDVKAARQDSGINDSDNGDGGGGTAAVDLELSNAKEVERERKEAENRKKLEETSEKRFYTLGKEPTRKVGDIITDKNGSEYSINRINTLEAEVGEERKHEYITTKIEPKKEEAYEDEERRLADRRKAEEKAKEEFEVKFDSNRDKQDKNLPDYMYKTRVYDADTNSTREVFAIKIDDNQGNDQQFETYDEAVKGWEKHSAKKPKKKKSKGKKVKKADTMLQHIAKSGGINFDNAHKLWGRTITDLSGNKKINNKIVGRPILRKKGGMTVDQMAESLAEAGYLAKDENGKYDIADFFEKMSESFAGREVFTPADVADRGPGEAEIQEQEKELEDPRLTKAKKQIYDDGIKAGLTEKQAEQAVDESEGSLKKWLADQDAKAEKDELPKVPEKKIQPKLLESQTDGETAMDLEAKRKEEASEDFEFGAVKEKKQGKQKALDEMTEGEKKKEKPKPVDTKKVKKLRKLADGLDKQIDAKRNPGVSQQAPTARRASIAASMARDADKLEQAQQILRGIADDIENGTLPAELEGISSKADVDYFLARNRYSGPYINKHYMKDVIAALKGVKGMAEHREVADRMMLREEQVLDLTAKEVAAVEAAIKLDPKNLRYAKDLITDGKRVMRLGVKNQEDFDSVKDALLNYTQEMSAEEKNRREIKKLETELLGTKIPGFFPTPKNLINKMIEDLDLEEGNEVLEPSAGKGDIADALKEKGFAPFTIEIVPSLQSLLERKGHKVIDQDFLEHSQEYDRIIMNPPFEKGADIEHVQHAYDLLKPGGRMVAIMSEGPFFRSDKKATEFREWLESVEGYSEKLESGSFKGAEAFRQTGVASRIVEIDKGASEETSSTSEEAPVSNLMELSGIQEEGKPKKKKTGKKRKSTGTGGTGNAMGIASTGDSFAQTEEEEIQRDNEKEPTEPSNETLIQVAERKISENQYVQGAMDLLMPQSRGTAGQLMSLIKRKRTSESAQLDEVTRAKLHEASKKFHWMSNDEVVEFIDRMEDPNGARPQATAELDEIAGLLRAMLDKGRARVQEHGALNEYIENYFPHMFKPRVKKVVDKNGNVTVKDVNRDVISGLLSKRKLVPKGFLKKRKYLTLKEGLDSGLELAHYNPVEMTILRLHEMHRYVAGKKIINDLKEQGLAIFVPADMEKNYKKSGWEFVDDPSLIFEKKPEMNVPEAYDKLLVDQLTGVLVQMGVRHDRVQSLKGKNTWGMSFSGKAIKTKFAGPISILAHEIGHQIGDNYGLYNYMTKGEHLTGRVYKTGKKAGQPVKADIDKKRAIIKKEMQKLADLRIETIEKQVKPSFKKYIRKRVEKEAVMLEAWLAAPEKMAEVAPTITAAWKDFLAANEDLAPLAHLNRSVVLGDRKQVLTMAGVHKIGQWAIPEQAATILKRHLAPGLGSNKNIIVRNAYDGIRRLRNLSLMASHGWSAFHGINVATDSLNTHIQLGLQKLARGDYEGAVKAWKNANPYGVYKDIWVTGKNIRDAMEMELDEIQDPKMRRTVEAIIQAGGSATMDAAYRNNAQQGLIDSLRKVKFGDTSDKVAGAVAAPINAAMAVTEKVSSLIMEHEVPRLKLSCFYHMAEDIYGQAEKHGWNDFRIQKELAGAWDNVDNRMGQLRYDNLNWNRTAKELIMLAFRAPGWTLGSIREFGGAAWDTATFFRRIGNDQDLVTRRMGYSIGAGVSYALQGMLIQYLLTGEPPEEPKDLYFPRTGNLNSDGSRERLSMPHYSKDIIAWLTQPSKTLTHKLNPLWGTAVDLFFTNEDYFGRQIREGGPLDKVSQSIVYFFTNMFMPFSVRNGMKLHENGQTVPMSVSIGVSGISPAPAYISRSPAQKMMIQALRKRGGSRQVEHKDAEKQDRRRKIIKALRNGEVVPDEQYKGFTARQIKDMQEKAKLTPFQAQFDRLDFDEAVSVFAISSEDERRQAWPYLVKERMSEISPDDVSLAMYYELKLNHAQSDERIKGDIQICRNAAWQLTSKDIGRFKRAELIKVLKSNPQYEDDWKFVLASFRHRWLYTLDGRKSGRRVGSNSYWKRVKRLKKILAEEKIK